MLAALAETGSSTSHGYRMLTTRQTSTRPSSCPTPSSGVTQGHRDSTEGSKHLPAWGVYRGLQFWNKAALMFRTAATKKPLESALCYLPKKRQGTEIPWLRRDRTDLSFKQPRAQSWPQNCRIQARTLLA